MQPGIYIYIYTDSIISQVDILCRVICWLQVVWQVAITNLIRGAGQSQDCRQSPYAIVKQHNIYIPVAQQLLFYSWLVLGGMADSRSCRSRIHNLSGLMYKTPPSIMRVAQFLRVMLPRRRCRFEYSLGYLDLSAASCERCNGCLKVMRQGLLNKAKES